MTDHDPPTTPRCPSRAAATLTLLSAVALAACSAEVLDQDDIEVLEAQQERYGEPSEGVGVIRQAVMTEPYGDMKYIGNIPSDKETTWFDESQGVANGIRSDEQVMFWSSTRKIDGWAAPDSKLFGLGKTGDDYSPKWKTGLPSWGGSNTWNHFGDIDYAHNAQGTHDLLYAPIEYKGKGKYPRLVVYEVGKPGALKLIGYATLSAGGTNSSKEAPWVAAWKSDIPISRVVSSRFNIKKGEGVDLYDIDVDVSGRNVALSYQGVMKIVNDSGKDMWLSKIQGGEMNMGGDLFLLAQDGSKGPGVYVFEQEAVPGINRWRLADYLYAEIHPPSFDLEIGRIDADIPLIDVPFGDDLVSCLGEEFEGITVGLIDPPGSGNKSHVHALLRQFNCPGQGDDTNFFKHWEAKKNTNAFRQR